MVRDQKRTVDGILNWIQSFLDVARPPSRDPPPGGSPPSLKSSHRLRSLRSAGRRSEAGQRQGN
eukprot:817871-Pyramimonas_sp.AAC.5